MEKLSSLRLYFASKNIFGLPTLGARDGLSSVGDLTSSFDYNQLPLPPLIESANFVYQQIPNYVIDTIYGVIAAAGIITTVVVVVIRRRLKLQPTKTS